jgi:hypothetical protein
VGVLRWFACRFVCDERLIRGRLARGLPPPSIPPHKGEGGTSVAIHPDASALSAEWREDKFRESTSVKPLAMLGTRNRNRTGNRPNNHTRPK